jgi:hypothetical protein
MGEPRHQLTEHHQGEHDLVWPALDAIRIPRPTIDTFDAEHEAMGADLASGRTVMGQPRSSASRSDADTAAAVMDKLQLTTVTHLDRE